MCKVIFITGSSGFIGSNLAKRILTTEPDTKVIGLDNMNDYYDVRIKEARLEALRTGFKNCYQEKDFATIVRVGDRIPQSLLTEDDVLLQYYDIATNRI